VFRIVPGRNHMNKIGPVASRRTAAVVGSTNIVSKYSVVVVHVDAIGQGLTSVGGNWRLRGHTLHVSFAILEQLTARSNPGMFVLPQTRGELTWAKITSKPLT